MPSDQRDRTLTAVRTLVIGVAILAAAAACLLAIFGRWAGAANLGLTAFVNVVFAIAIGRLRQRRG